MLLSVLRESSIGARGRELQDIRGNSQQNFQKKNGESLRLRGLDGIENISFLLQYFGVSEGANFEKWHSEFEISVTQPRDCKFLDLQTCNQEEDGKPQIFPAVGFYQHQVWIELH